MPGAFDRLRRQSRPSRGDGHRKQVDAHHAACALHDEIALQRLHIPGKLELSRSFLATHYGAPFVVKQVGVANTIGIEPCLDVFNLAKKSGHQVESMYAQIAKRISTIPVLRRHRPAWPRWIVGAAEVVDGKDIA